MKYKRRDLENAVIVELRGKVEGGPDAESFREMFKTLAKEGKTNVIVSLKDVEWIASTGIGVLIRCYKSIVEAGGKFALVNVGERTDHVFNIMRLDHIFKSFDSEEEALKHFGQSG